MSYISSFFPFCLFLKVRNHIMKLTENVKIPEMCVFKIRVIARTALCKA